MTKREIGIGILSAVSTWYACFGGVVQKWTVETSGISSQPISAYHGETVEMSCLMTSYGRVVTGCSVASFLWQTNGMGTAWWETNATFSAGTVKSNFTPEMDAGADSYVFFFRVTDTKGSNYRSNGTITLLGSPAGHGGEIPFPVKRLDFSAIEVANAGLAPWELKGRTNAVDMAAVTNAAWRVVTNAVETGYVCTVTNAHTIAGETAAGAANDAVSAHNASSAAHAALFASKRDMGDMSLLNATTNVNGRFGARFVIQGEPVWLYYYKQSVWSTVWSSDPYYAGDIPQDHDWTGTASTTNDQTVAVYKGTDSGNMHQAMRDRISLLSEIPVVDIAAKRDVTNRTWSAETWTGEAISRIEASHGKISRLEIVNYMDGKRIDVYFGELHEYYGAIYKNEWFTPWSTQAEAESATNGYFNGLDASPVTKKQAVLLALTTDVNAATNVLQGRTYDLTTDVGIRAAVGDVIRSLGGSVSP